MCAFVIYGKDAGLHYQKAGVVMSLQATKTIETDRVRGEDFTLPESLLRQKSGISGSFSDPHDLVNAIVGGLFSLVFPNPQARRQLGLRAASCVMEESMTWYVWSEHCPGALAMTLLPGRPEGHPDGALLALRYFPDPEEAIFAGFSPLEQQVRCSPLFDATGTPPLQTEAGLDPSLFYIGTLTIVPRGENEVSLYLNAQDRWVEQTQESEDWLTHRQVPGLQLALLLFDLLVCGLGLLGRRPPVRVRVGQQPGLLWRIDENAQVFSCPDEHLIDWEIEVQTLAPGRQATESLVAQAGDFSGMDFFSHVGDSLPVHVPWPAKLLWWQAASWPFAAVGVFCGRCAAEDEAMHHHHHHHQPERCFQEKRQ